MSLDVYLKLVGSNKSENGSGIFVRENGQNKEISRDEWNEKFPGREPVVFHRDGESSEVYSANITHNLGRMAREAGIYEYLWRPDEIDICVASQLIDPLRKGLELLMSNPERFEQYNPSNGWGSYEGLLEFTKNYLAACEMYPDAEIFVSR